MSDIPSGEGPATPRVDLDKWIETDLGDVWEALEVIPEGKRVAAGLHSLADRHCFNRGISLVPGIMDGCDGMSLLVIHSEGGCWTSRASELQVPLIREEGRLSIAHVRPLNAISDRWTAAARAAGLDLFDEMWPILWTSGSDGRFHRYTVPDVLAAVTVKGALRKEGECLAIEHGLVESCEAGGYVDPVWTPGYFQGLYGALGRRWLADLPEMQDPPEARLDAPLFLRPPAPQPETHNTGDPAEEPMADWERELLTTAEAEGA